MLEDKVTCGLTRLHRKPGFFGFLVLDDLFTKVVKPGFWNLQDFQLLQQIAFKRAID
jgi:hypothetical protein